VTAPALPDPDEVLAALRRAVAEAFAPFGELPTRWVLLAESLGLDGERGLWSACSEEAKPWDTLGLLHFAAAREAAKIARDDDHPG